jgi:hypothetical protein
MPEFTTVSVQEAMVRTIPGRQGSFLTQYIDYIQQLPQGQAGKLHVLAHEKPFTIRRWLARAAQTLEIPLIIKRSGNELYFWREDGGEEPSRRRGRRPRRQDEPVAEETVAPDQPSIEPEEVEQEETGDSELD